MIFQRITCTFLMKSLSEPEERISVMNTTSSRSRLIHEPKKEMMFPWSSCSSSRTSCMMRIFSCLGSPASEMVFHATSRPSLVSYARYTILYAPFPSTSLNLT